MRSKTFVIFGMLLAAAVQAGAQYARPKIADGVSIEQKLNKPVPLDLVFRDESNHTVPLWKYFRDKPVVISLVYFNCPSLCPMSLHETVSTVKHLVYDYVH